MFQQLFTDIRANVTSIIPLVDNRAKHGKQKSEWVKSESAILITKLTTDDQLVELLRKPTILHIKFTSAYQADFLIRDLAKCNNEFCLRMYCPALIKDGDVFKEVVELKKKFEHYFILINGFAESDPSMHDHFGISFATQDKPVPSILLPMPYHFVRDKAYRDQTKAEIDEFVLNVSPVDISYKRILSTQRIINSLLGDPTRFNKAFYQSISDIFTLADIIQTENERYLFRHFIEGDAKISMFGYSIGGLVVMNTMLLEHERKAGRKRGNFKSVFLLESGATLDNVKVNDILKRDERVAASLYRYYIDERKKLFGYESFFSRHTEEEEKRRDEFMRFFVSKEPPSDAQEYELSIEMPELKKYINEHDEVKKVKNEIKTFEKKVAKTRKEERHLKHLNFELRNLEKNWAKKKFSDILERDISLSNKVWFDLLDNLIANMGSDMYIREGFESDDVKRLVVGFYGTNPYQRKKALKRMSTRIMIIVGGQDNIFPVSQIINNSPEEGLATLLVPNITHFIKTRESSKEWLKWRDFLIGTIASFNDHVKIND